MTTNKYLALGAISGCLAVGMGAFGAHALQNSLNGRLLNAYHTATDYQMYHSLALVLASILLARCPSSKTLLWSNRLFFFGILVFSGSLYLLAITGKGWLGIVTPIGGLSFMLGWVSLAAFAINYSKA